MFDEDQIQQPDPHPPLYAAESSKLLNDLVSCAITPLSRLRDTINLTLEQVTRWIEDPGNRQQISSLVTLLDAQAQLLICQQRVVAVAKLIEVASTSRSPETTRRACADLLKIRLIDPYREDKRPYVPPRPGPSSNLTEEQMYRVLDRLGREEPDDGPFPPSAATDQLAEDREQSHKPSKFGQN